MDFDGQWQTRIPNWRVVVQIMKVEIVATFPEPCIKQSRLGIAGVGGQDVDIDEWTKHGVREIACQLRPLEEDDLAGNRGPNSLEQHRGCRSGDCAQTLRILKILGYWNAVRSPLSRGDQVQSVGAKGFLRPVVDHTLNRFPGCHGYIRRMRQHLPNVEEKEPMCCRARSQSFTNSPASRVFIVPIACRNPVSHEGYTTTPEGGGCMSGSRR